MRVEFSISQWSAWAPGLGTPEAWESWAQKPAPAIVPRGKDTPPLTEVPPMQRRRVEKIARLAFQVATWCQGEQLGAPLLFASRHGDVARSLDLLISLAKDEPLSPTSFGLSVHNAIGAQYSIIRGERASVTAVANGLFTLEAALVDAAVLLREVPEVVVVAYDASLPDLFEKHLDEPQTDFAFAWKVTRGTDFALECLPVTPETKGPAFPDVPTASPHTLDVFRFFLAKAGALECSNDLHTWKWVRRG
ncbi:MAG: beta-ketoacyl synthase chain length factor [Myxococcaceae bacterium]